MSDRQPFIRPEQCETCIFRPGNPMRLRRGRVAEMVRNAVRADSHIVCHSTLDRPTAEQQACAGFAAKHSTNSLRIGERLDWLFRRDKP